jgi:hypothetical protein
MLALLTLVLLFAAACDKGPREGDACNQAGKRSGNGLVCKRNNRTTGPLVWRRADGLPSPMPAPTDVLDVDSFDP